MYKKYLKLIILILALFILADYFYLPKRKIIESKLVSNVYRDCFYYNNSIFWSVNTPYHIIDNIKNIKFKNFGIYDINKKNTSLSKLDNISESRFFFTYNNNVYLLTSLDCYLYKISDNGTYIKLVNFKNSGWIYNATIKSGYLYFTIAGGMKGNNVILYKLNLNNCKYETIDTKRSESIGKYHKVINFDHYGNLWMYSYDNNSFFVYRLKDKQIYEIEQDNTNKIVTLEVNGNIVIKNKFDNIQSIKKYHLFYSSSINVLFRLNRITDSVNIGFLNSSLKNAYYISSNNQIVLEKKYKISLSEIMKIYPTYNIDISDKQDRDIEWVDHFGLHYRIIGFDGLNLIINKVGYLDFYYINKETLEIKHDKIYPKSLIKAPISSLSVLNDSIWYSSYITHGEIYDNYNSILKNYFYIEGQIDFLYTKNCINDGVKFMALTYPGAVLYEFCNKHNVQTKKIVIPGNFQRFVKSNISKNNNCSYFDNIIVGIVESDYTNLKSSAFFIKTDENVSIYNRSKFKGNFLDDIYLDKKNIYAISKSFDNYSFVYLKHGNDFKLLLKLRDVKIIEIKNNHILYLENNRIIDFDIINKKSVILYTNSILSYFTPIYVKYSNGKLVLFYSEYFIYINLFSKKISFSLNRIRYSREGAIKIENNSLYVSQADKIFTYKLN